MRTLFFIVVILFVASFGSRGLADEVIAEAPVAEPADESRSAMCGSQQIEAIYRRRGALVEVGAPSLRGGLGLVVGHRRLVLTSFFAVEPGRGIEVTHAGRTVSVLRVVAVDEAHDLALVLLDEPLGAEPLPLSPTAMAVGDPVVSLARAFDGQSYLVEARPGVVSSDDGGWRSDALLGAGGPLTPLFGCDGAVLGLARGWGEGFDPVAPAADLLADEQAEAYAGSWSMAHMSATFPIQIDHGTDRDGSRDAYVGVSLGTALIGHDRLYFPLRFSLLAMPADGQLPDDAWKRTGMRLQADTGIGYRWMLSEGAWATYLVPQIGVAAGFEWIRHHRSRHVVSGCTPGGHCEAQHVDDEWSESSLYLRPTVGMALQTGPIELHYQLLIDPERFGASVHQFGWGVAF